MTRHQTIQAMEASKALTLRLPVLEDLPRVELRQLRYFLAVAEELNFTRAAERMGIAQPPLSQQIISLEHQLRAKLFERSHRQVKLTPEGEILQSYARRILNTTMLAAESIRALASGQNGQIAVGAVCSALHSVLPSILQALVERHPGIKVHLQEMTVLEQHRALREERIDIGIVREPMASSDFATRKLFTEPFVAVVSRHSPLARLNRVSLEQISRQPLIQVSKSTNQDYSDHMFTSLIEKGLRTNVVHEASDMQSLLGLVGAGIGVSLVPASLRHVQISNVAYVPLSDSVKGSTLSLAWNTASVTPVIGQFLETVDEYMSGIEDPASLWTPPFVPTDRRCLAN